MNKIMKEKMGALVNQLKADGLVFASDSIDPENIVNHFEDCLDPKYKKEHGIVYTPQYIADFMVFRAFQLWVIHKFGKDIDELYTDNKQEVLTAFRNAIVNIKICDPCVGAGIYPMAVIKCLYDETLNINKLLGIAEQPFEIYRRIIESNLYCVDLDKNAVAITTFRLWAFLQEINPDFKDFRCNIVNGNTLNNHFMGLKMIYNHDLSDYSGDINEVYISGSGADEFDEFDWDSDDSSSGNSENTGESESIIEHWNKLWNVYMNATGGSKVAAKVDIVTMSLNLSAKLSNKQAPNFTAQHLKGGNSLTNQMLMQLDFSKAFEENGGFDLFVGNPPYVSSGNIQEDKTMLNELFPNIFMGTADLCLYFFEKGMQVCNKDGVISLITTNKWLNSEYAYNFRNTLKDKLCLIEILDFKDKQIFDNAGVDVAITTIYNGGNSPTFKYCDISALRKDGTLGYDETDIEDEEADIEDEGYED